MYTQKNNVPTALHVYEQHDEQLLQIYDQITPLSRPTAAEVNTYVMHIIIFVSLLYSPVTVVD